MDFLNYWDTRIDANERFFNNYPHIANFAFSECQKLWDRMEEKNKALLARHNALVEAVAWLLDAQSIVDENITCPNWRRHVGISDIVRQARAEVDRLIGEGEG